MKKIILITFILFFNSCNSQKRIIEDRLYNCFINSLTNEQLDKYIILLSDYEDYLIENKILESKNAKSYWKFYKVIAESESLNLSNDFNFHKKFTNILFESRDKLSSIYDCNESVERTKEFSYTSRYKIMNEIKSLDKVEGNNPILISKLMLKYMTIDEFKHKYNKMSTLLFIEKYKNYKD